MDSKFCCAENFSVLIPYRDLEALLEIARNYDKLEARMKRIEEKNTALQGLYSEVLEKLQDIQDNL